MELYIITDSNFQDWQAYEVYDRSIGRVVLHTEEWNKVVELFGGNVPAPVMVEVN